MSVSRRRTLIAPRVIVVGCGAPNLVTRAADAADELGLSKTLGVERTVAAHCSAESLMRVVAVVG